jgi:hypothetical protein
MMHVCLHMHHRGDRARTWLLWARQALFIHLDEVAGAVAGVTGHFVLDAPATPERIRMACSDHIVPKEQAAYRAKLSC